jgi:hypothetical protein
MKKVSNYAVGVFSEISFLASIFFIVVNIINKNYGLLILSIICLIASVILFWRASGIMEKKKNGKRKK